MKTVARCVLIVAAILLCSSISVADEQSHRKAAEEFLEITNARKVMELTVDQMLDAQIKANPSAAHLRPVLKRFLSKYLSYDNLKDQMIKIYTEEFTEDELKQLAEFYQTPVGKKAIEKLPKLAARGAQMGVAQVQANQAELKQMIIDEDKKRNAN